MAELSKLHRAVAAGAYTSWLRWYPFLLGSRLHCTASGAMSQPCFVCVHLRSSDAVVWLLVTLVCSQCSPVSTVPCWPWTLQLPIRCYLCLPRSLQSQPISCRHSFYLPPRPRTGGGAEFSLDFFSFWGWNGCVREPSSATFKLLGADKQVTDSHSMSSQHRHCPCIPCPCLAASSPVRG